MHVHFELRLFAGSTKSYEFTSQFFFDEPLTTAVHANGPYGSRGTRDVVDTRDGIHDSRSTAEKAALTLRTSKVSDGYAGVTDLGVQVG